MAKNKRVAGTIYLRLNGALLRAVGDFSWNLGLPKNESVVGATGNDGVKRTEQIPFIEGLVRTTAQFDPVAVATGRAETATLEIGSGATVVLRDATYCHEGTGQTEEGTFPVRWEGASATWIPAPQTE